MDYHSATAFTRFLHFPLLAITPAASAVLIFIALLLFVISFLVAGAEVAFFALTYKEITNNNSAINISTAEAAGVIASKEKCKYWVKAVAEW